MNDDYTPSPELLKKYADVLVKFALNSGMGVQAGEVVQLAVPDVAKPLALALQHAVLEVGGHPMIRLLPTGFDKNFFELASDEQLTHFPKRYLKERANLINHTVSIIAEPDPEELKDIDHHKIFRARNARKKYREWLDKKENQGNFTWTIGLYGVPAKAELVGLSLEDYWQQIIQACFLDYDDPISEWQKVFKLQEKIKKKINDLPIEKLEIKGSDIDMVIQIGLDRQWVGGSGRNIPSFEIFTSPNWRGTEGWVKFNQPLYRYGNIIDGIELEFKKGKVVAARAKRGQDALKEMLKTKDADKLGEYSLTDKRMSRITHPMAETLFDENIGGEFGNTHMAIGRSYDETYKGDPNSLTRAEFKKRGFNHSAEHTDMVSTTDRTVTAILSDGTRKVIYKNGQFVV